MAVTVISAVNPDPETSKLCSVEADPSQVPAVSEPDTKRTCPLSIKSLVRCYIV